jgi:hypothetical protein
VADPRNQKLIGPAPMQARGVRLSHNVMARFIRMRPIRRLTWQHAMCALVVLGITGSQSSTVAQPRAVAPPAQSEGSALTEIARVIAAGLGPISDGALIVSSPLQSDGPIEKPQELAARLSALVAGAVGRNARSEGPMSLSRARAQATPVEQLIFLSAEIARGELRVRADSYRGKTRFWERLREPRPAPLGHAFAARRLDAELSRFLPPIPLVAKRIDRVRLQDRDWVALACGDSDQDGSLELVLVSRRRIEIARVQSGRLSPLVARSWNELGSVAPSPLREPIAGIAIGSRRFIDVGSSDRADALRFDPRLSVLARLGRRVPWAAGGCSSLAGVALSTTIEPCAKGDTPAPGPDFGQAVDAIASARIVNSAGKAHFYYAARLANSATVVLRDSAGKSARIEGVGAQLALADLDLDGQPELLSASATLDAREDFLSIRTWQSAGSISERLRMPVPAGVRALAVCPPESNGLLASVVVTGEELWVLR